MKVLGEFVNVGMISIEHSIQHHHIGLQMALSALVSQSVPISPLSWSVFFSSRQHALCWTGFGVVSHLLGMGIILPYIPPPKNLFHILFGYTLRASDRGVFWFAPSAEAGHTVFTTLMTALLIIRRRYFTQSSQVVYYSFGQWCLMHCNGCLRQDWCHFGWNDAVGCMPCFSSPLTICTDKGLLFALRNGIGAVCCSSDSYCMT